MDVRLIRRRNLRALIDNDPVAQGNVVAWCSAMAAKHGATLNPNFIRQLVPKRVAEADRNFGEKAARKIEEMLHLPHLSLDDPGQTVSENRIDYAMIAPPEVTELVGLFSSADDKSRQMILAVARAATPAEPVADNPDPKPEAKTQTQVSNEGAALRLPDRGRDQLESQNRKKSND